MSAEQASYYAKDGYVWMRPVSRRMDDGLTSITIGFRVCEMTAEVGDDCAFAIARLMNRGDRLTKSRQESDQLADALKVFAVQDAMRGPTGVPMPDWLAAVTGARHALRECGYASGIAAAPADETEGLGRRQEPGGEAETPDLQSPTTAPGAASESRS